MTVVSHAPEGKHFIFRGSVATEFLAGLEVIAERAVKFQVGGVTRGQGKLLITPAGKPVLVIGPEEVSDLTAQVALESAFEAFQWEVLTSDGRR